jgi:hypothetical protein
VSSEHWLLVFLALIINAVFGFGLFVYAAWWLARHTRPKNSHCPTDCSCRSITP